MTPFTLTRDEVRELDRQAIEGFGVPGVVLMENAGRGCAELLMRLNPEREPVVILCGPGNNGGDGFVIARHLDNAGWRVKVAYLHTGRFAADAGTNFRILEAAGIDRIPILDANHSHGAKNWFTEEGMNTDCWIVDAFFGTGLSRPLDSPSDEFVSMLNASRNPVLAVDIPSGLDCDTGEPLGACVKATHTATFVASKRGFLNPASKAWTGEVHVIDIGAPRILVEEYRLRGERGA